MANLRGKPMKKRKGPQLEEAQEEVSTIKKDMDSERTEGFDEIFDSWF